MKFLVYLFCLLITLPAGLKAQGMPFSTAQTPDVRKGRVWTRIQTEHFDVWFNPSEKEMGELAAQYAEYHMKDLCHLLDYKPRSRFVLHVFPNPESWWHSSLYMQSLTLPQGGITKLDGNTASVYYQTGQQGLYRQTRQAACQVLMHEIYYGQTIQFSMQQQMMLDLPEWFRNGIPAWEGEGWTAEDEARMRSISAKGYIRMTQYDLDPDMTRTLQKSIWFYIAHKFSPLKVYSIMYMTRVSRSAQSGIITVLGVNMETFTERWREFYVQRYQTDAGTRRSLSKESREVKTVPEGYRLCNAALHPSGEKIAAVGEKNGRYKLFITNLRSGKITPVALPGGMPSYRREVASLPVPMSWDAEGKKIAMVITQGLKPAFLTWSMENGSLKKGKLPGALEQVHGLDWNHEKGRMAITGSRKGKCDLFILEPEGNLKQITEDYFDESNPMWSKDEQSIYFSTNRRSDSTYVYSPQAVHGDLNICRYSLSENKIFQVTQNILSNEKPLFQPSSFELIYLSDESGIAGLARKNVFIGDSLDLTNFDAGIEQVQIQGNKALITAWSGSRLKTFTSENLNTTKSVKPQATEYKKEQRKDAAEKKAAREKLADIEDQDSIPDLPENGELIRVTTSDSSKNKKPLKYYLFDEEENPKPENKPSAPRQVGNQPLRLNNTKLLQTEEKPLPADYSETELKTPSNAKARRTWYMRELGTTMAFDPIFRYHLDLYATLSDIHKQHEVTLGFKPYFNFRSSDFYSRWEWKKNRWQPGASFQRAVRFYEANGNELRSTIHSYKAWIGWSFNRRTRLTGGLRYEAIWRSDVSLNLIRNPAEIFLPGTFMRLDWDHILKRENIILSGSRASITWDNYLINGTRRSDPLAMIQVDARKYVKFLKESVLAIRFTAGMSAGAVKPVFMLGGVDNWLNARFQNTQEIPVPQPAEGLWLLQIKSPVRGFAYNGRNGSQFAALNGELRFPILKYLSRSLNTGPLYNFQLVAFYDIGTVWTRGNPLSQKNPVNSLTIEKNPFIIHVQSLKSPFIAGAGGGFRMSVMRYILRFDLALGLEDGAKTKPQFSIALGSDF